MKVHLKRNTFMTQHHCFPKIRQHSNTHNPKYKIKLWRDRHNALHCMFNTKTIVEIIKEWDSFSNHYNTDNWKILFHNLNFEEGQMLFIRLYELLKKRRL